MGALRRKMGDEPRPAGPGRGLRGLGLTGLLALAAAGSACGDDGSGTGGGGGTTSASSGATGTTASSTTTSATTSATTATTTGSSAGGGGAGGSNAGGGGAGGSTSSVGGSGGSPPPECEVPGDCPGQDGPCRTRTCDEGNCGELLESEGVLTPDQTAEDCLQEVCDGRGGVTSAPDDDPFDDGNDCTVDACDDGERSNLPTAPRTPCGDADELLCDGDGACVECIDGTDCATGVCGAGLCVAASCSDDVQNDDETDVDCGGSCAPCDDGLGCLLGEDCVSQVCEGDVCSAPACDDDVQNGDEIALDCGGSCPGCGVGTACDDPTDCDSGRCDLGICAPVLLFSEVRTRGSAGATDEFIELYNPTSEPVTLDATWEIFSRGAANAGSCMNTPSVRYAGVGQLVPARGHVLIAVIPGYDDGVVQDGSYGNQFVDGGNLILRHGGDDLDALCFFFDAVVEARLLDPTCNYTCEGAPISNLPHDNGATLGGDVDLSLERRPGGALGNGQDTGDNASDFQMVASSPQNVASPATP